MGREVSYEDAVKLLGGDTAKIVRLADTLVGVGLLAATGPFQEVLSWFDAKAELTKVTEHLVTSLADRRSGLSRFERTERLQAAHAALAVTAFFEAMAAANLPIRSKKLKLTAEEQRLIAGGEESTVAGWSTPVPGPAESHTEFRARLIAFYERTVVARVKTFVEGLAVWDELRHYGRAEFHRSVEGLPAAAIARFDSLLGKLAADFPEVAFWAGMREQSALHALLCEVRTGVADLREFLDGITDGRPPDGRRRELARRYAAALQRPIVESGEVPAGLRVPLLGEAFLPQLFRVVEVRDEAKLSSEDWWEQQSTRNDLLGFLTGHLTSMAATTAPLLILGQPGSGKSVLAKILAGQLPPAGFMPVLVMLRAVHAAADVQDQIEQAIREDTGERVEWPALARSSGDALPLVILDGFDELLQATGVSQTDYLRRVAAFQRREAELGRPVAVIVTSRTSVADRAATPEGAVAVRLEPFDRFRVEAWLDVWNAVNETRFAAGPDQPLDLGTVMRYPHLAEQPLLLLMLALYDAEGNALREAGDLRTEELYERLLRRFARREVTRLGDALPPRERELRVEAELRKLSVVAFAMFNRGTQWATEAELEGDLQALPGLTATVVRPAPPADLRAPLQAAELTLGSFFFVHRARATRDGIALETYEFLHATFGEFLVARLIHGVVRNLIALEQASAFPSGEAADDDLLHALLSFAPLAGRRQTVDFLRGIVSAMPPAMRTEWTDLLVRLFRPAMSLRPPRAFGDYLPRHRSLSVYSANLLLLALCADDIRVSRLFGGDDTHNVEAWRDMCLRWRSESAAGGWLGMLDLIRVDRVRRAGRIDVSLSLGSPAEPPPVDLSWLLRMDSDGDARVWMLRDPIGRLRQEAHFTCDFEADLLQHVLDPLVAAGLKEAGAEVRDSAGGFASALNVLTRLGVAESMAAANRMALYREALAWHDRHPAIVRSLLDRLTTDDDAHPDLVAEILDEIWNPETARDHRIRLVRCGMAHLDPVHGRPLAGILKNIIASDRGEWNEIDIEASIRLAELDLGRLSILRQDAERLSRLCERRRPDLVERLRILING